MDEVELLERGDLDAASEHWVASQWNECGQIPYSPNIIKLIKGRSWNEIG